MTSYRFGPNTADVEVIIEKANRMTLEQAKRFKDKITAGEIAGIDDIYHYADKYGRTEALEQLIEHELVDLFDAKVTSPEDEAYWHQALLLTRRAAAATLMRDCLSDNFFGCLYKQWRLVMEKNS